MGNPIRVGIVGVGNCASALIQGVNHYRALGRSDVPGVMLSDIGGYGPTDIRFVLGFDVDRRKVGKPLSEAIFAAPNCARIFHTDITDSGPVLMGEVHDGIAPHMLNYHERINFQPAKEEPVNVVNALHESKVDLLVNYLPVGSQKATEFYAECALAAGVPFLNCIPVFIASDETWEQRFIDAGLPLVGDDIKSMFGASILSQVLQETLFNRGHDVAFHSQLNIGGNTDFANMMDLDRVASKKTSKENVIRSQYQIRGKQPGADAVFAGPSSFIAHHGDNKTAHLQIEAEGFGGAPVTIEAKLSVCDSENSAGVVIDTIRYLKVAHEMGVVGALRGPSAWTQKTPPEQMRIEEAQQECEQLARRELTERTRRQIR